MTDILIGAADGYGWDEIKPWVKSARLSGFTGLIYLILYRVKGDKQALLDELAKYNVQTYEVEHTPYMTRIQHAQKGSPTQAHSVRFYHAWELLTQLANDASVINDLQQCIMTDVRDVVFQRNPSEYFAARTNTRPIIAASEGIYFQNEPWNQDNLIQGFGQAFWELEATHWKAYNVGTIAGHWTYMRTLFHTIFTMTEGRYYPSDQSSFNVLLHGSYQPNIQRLSHEDTWACQLGVMGDTTKPQLLEKVCEPLPIIDKTTGMVYNYKNEPFVIVHQWDRNAYLKPIIDARYA
jgi:hypothetical protein